MIVIAPFILLPEKHHKSFIDNILCSISMSSCGFRLKNLLTSVSHNGNIVPCKMIIVSWESYFVS